jgi:hypothetical protein
MKKYLILTIALISFAFFNVQAQMSVLLVNDNGWAPDRVEIIKTALDNSGYCYAYWDAPTEASGPSFEFMQGFNLVIWYTGNDGAALHFWNGNETENQDIMDYIDNGGMFWLQGLDFLYDKYPGINPDSTRTFVPGEFPYDYLGMSLYYGQSHVDDGVWSDGVPQLDLVEGNGIFTIDPLLWTYDAMNYVDALLKTDDAQYIYQMGPEGYDLNDYYSAIYNEKGDGKVLSFTFETARIDTQENTDLLFQEGLDYFAQFATPGILAESIDVSSEGGATAIEENNGTLQFYSEILPGNTTIPFVKWSVVSDGVDATITQDGLLKSAGVGSGNGVVWVKAEALDCSGTVDSMEVVISGQGIGFNVLLVNDCAATFSGGTTRYLVIDTSLNNLDYAHNIYNTIETGEYPDYSTLSQYGAVIWFTGNDRWDLKLWDVSDTAGAVNQNLKFNEPLMQYINEGGIVWLNGIDFIRDIYLDAPDFFATGDFVYDYMGIKTYVAQSHADGPDVTQFDVVQGNPICNFTPIKFYWDSGLWYADGYEITDDADGIYTMGPDNYVFSDYYSGVFSHPGDGHLFSFSAGLARLDNNENTDILIGQVLSYFETIAPQAINEYENLDFTLCQNSPNPVSDQTTVSYELNEKANVSFAIYDISGKKVYTREMGNQNSGMHKIDLSVKNAGLSGGFYTYTLTVNNQVTGGKMIVNP